MFLEHLLQYFDQNLMLRIYYFFFLLTQANLLHDVDGSIVNPGVLSRLFVAGLLNGIDIEFVFRHRLALDVQLRALSSTLTLFLILYHMGLKVI